MLNYNPNYNHDAIHRILKRDEITPSDKITVNYKIPSKIELILHANKYEIMMNIFWDYPLTYKIERQFGRYMRPVKMTPCIPTNYQNEMKSRFDSLIEELSKDDYEITFHPSGLVSFNFNLEKEKDPTISMIIKKFNGHYEYNCDYREYN